MNTKIPGHLALIAGNGVYPLLLAESARKSGVKRITIVAFRHETDPKIEQHADEIHWLKLGQLQKLLDILEQADVECAVMAGQLTPTALFHVKPDDRIKALLARLPERNAQTIFGAVADELKTIGVEVLPAHVFMESHMATAGQIGKRAPTDSEQADIEIGLKAARLTSDLDIGQTVIVKQGTILAVEAFEGTDKAIKRAGTLGGSGVVVVKVAKQSHDMRFDIPVIGMKTLKLLRKAGAGVLAVEAGRTLLLEREKLVAEADRLGICMVGVEEKILTEGRKERKEE